uniref:MP n=1 Tax=Avocado betaflexivirus 1 TaxID=2794401 RepID=A0A7T5QZ68_9VIRU|nr:MP [Avocado betaflexivirus 1]
MAIYEKRFNLNHDWQINHTELSASICPTPFKGYSATIIPFCPPNLLKDLKEKKFGYLHWGTIIVETVNLCSKKDIDAIFVLRDLRMLDERQGIVQSKQTTSKLGRISLRFDPDFLVSTSDPLAAESLQLVMLFSGITMVEGSLPVAIKCSGVYKGLKNLTEDTSYREKVSWEEISTDESAALLSGLDLKPVMLEQSTKWPSLLHVPGVSKTYKGTVGYSKKGLEFRSPGDHLKKRKQVKQDDDSNSTDDNSDTASIRRDFSEVHIGDGAPEGAEEKFRDGGIGGNTGGPMDGRPGSGSFVWKHSAPRSVRGI